MEINKDIINFETMSFTDRMNYRAHLAAMMDTIDKINKSKPETLADLTNNQEWVDNEDDDDDYSSSDGEDSRGEEYDDANEY
tara:strand:+ start:452 stop:697 length:246 start_codon:yes stop_codon:yes gene_type:complete